MDDKDQNTERKKTQLNDLSSQINWSYQKRAHQMPSTLNFTMEDQKIL